MSDEPSKDFSQLMRDTAYAAVGLGVLGFQKAQVHRHEVADALGAPGATFAQFGEQLGAQVRAAGEAVRPQIDALRPQLDALRPQAEAVGAQLLSILKTVDGQLSSTRHDLEGRLPESAQSKVAHLREAAAQGEQALRRALGLEDS